MAFPSQSSEHLIQRSAHSTSPWPYQAGHYWVSLAPLLCHIARNPEKLNDVSGSTQPVNVQPVVKLSVQRTLVHCVNHGSTLAFFNGKNKIASQSCLYYENCICTSLITCKVFTNVMWSCSFGNMYLKFSAEVSNFLGSRKTNTLTFLMVRKLMCWTQHWILSFFSFTVSWT